jgi:hypothetical protein
MVGLAYSGYLNHILVGPFRALLSVLFSDLKRPPVMTVLATREWPYKKENHPEGG